MSFVWIFVLCTDELIKLYEDTSASTVSYVPMDWQARMSELQTDANDIKKQISELEMLFEFVKKLLELNSEVSFLGGAEFVSTQASERLFSLTNAGEALLAQVNQQELDLAAAKAKHIVKQTVPVSDEEDSEL